VKRLHYLDSRDVYFRLADQVVKDSLNIAAALALREVVAMTTTVRAEIAAPADRIGRTRGHLQVHGGRDTAVRANRMSGMES
jgi:hypothetical protein